MIKLVNVGKIYSQEGNVSVGIRKVNLEFNVGEFVAITGESGSGKTTLLNILSGIDSYEEGEMFINGEETSYFTTEDLEEYRNKYVGFIFQNYNIIDSYTVKQNIEAALILNNYDPKLIKKRVKELVEEVGLSHRINTKASKLSGGEKQRVVIARALAKDPLIIAADEPTGNLDSETGKQIIELLHKISKDKLVLVVTHNFEEVKEYATRKIRVFDGEVKEDKNLAKESKNPAKVELIEKKKRSVFKLFPFSFVDLFASPKRMIFNMIVYFFMTFFVILGVAIQTNISGMGEASRYENSSFNDPKRIVLRKKDSSVFTDEDIESIEGNKDVKFVARHNFSNDSSRYLNFNIGLNYFGTYGYILPNYFLKESDVRWGELPKNSGECVIALAQSTLENIGYKNPKDLIGYSPYITEDLYTGIDLYDIPNFSTTIKGVIIDDDIKGYAELFVSNEDYENYSFKTKLIKYDKKISYIPLKGTEDNKITTLVEHFGTLAIDESLSGGEIIMSYSFMKEYEADPTGIDVNLSFENAIDGAVFEKKLTVKSYADNGDYALYISSADAQLIKEEIQSDREISIFTTNSRATNNVANYYRNVGYDVFLLKDVKSSPMIRDTFLGLFFFIFVVGFLVGTFFITFVILLHSARSRSDDVNILRTIGASKKDIKFMMIWEYLAMSLSGYLLFLVLYIILRNVTTGGFLIFLKYAGFVEFLISFIVMIIMTILMSLLFTRKIFGRTVRKGLSESKRA